MDITHDPITAGLVKGLAGKPTGGVPIGGSLTLHGDSRVIAVIDGQTYLRSGFLLANEQATYPVAYSVMSGPARHWNSVFVAGGTLQFKLASSPTVLLATHIYNGAGVVYRSVDKGLTWTGAALPGSPNTGTVKYVNGMFFLLYGDTYAYLYIFSSPDGITWTSRFAYYTPTSVYYPDIVFANGVYVCQYGDGRIATSTNGTSWTDRGSIPGQCGLVYFAGKFITGTGNSIRTSTDGITWISEGTFPANNLNNYSSSIERVFSVLDGVLYLLATGGVYSTTDLVTWTLVLSVTNPRMLSKIGTGFVLVTSSAIYHGTTPTTLAEITARTPTTSAIVHQGLVVTTGNPIGTVFTSLDDTIGIQAAQPVNGGYTYVRIK
jgi:hypothetical protein